MTPRCPRIACDDPFCRLEHVEPQTAEDVEQWVLDANIQWWAERSELFAPRTSKGWSCFDEKGAE